MKVFEEKKFENKKCEETAYFPVITADSEIAEGLNEEKIGEDSKGLLLMLIKQVRPGMDLSRIVFPTFVLEPRSTLERLSDYLAHCELLSQVPTLTDSKERFLGILKWYLSGFYIRPKGVKKPYNPILGELFRCMWNLPDSSQTYFVSEQVSHHPPIAAFYASNRKAGYIINGSIYFRSRFTGLTVGSILEGCAKLQITPFDEEYEITFPSVWAKGIFVGTLMMELCGVVTIKCAKTGYSADVEFKQKPFFGGEYNGIGGTIKHNEDILYTLHGKWDTCIDIKQENSEEMTTFWKPSPEIRKNKLPKYKPLMEAMEQFESNKLWSKVTDAIKRGDQQAATDEKAVLEIAQREAATLRGSTEHKPRLFDKVAENTWIYKYINKQPWDATKEVEEFEQDGIISSRKL